MAMRRRTTGPDVSPETEARPEPEGEEAIIEDEAPIPDTAAPGEDEVTGDPAETAATETAATETAASEDAATEDAAVVEPYPFTREEEEVMETIRSTPDNPPMRRPMRMLVSSSLIYKFMNLMSCYRMAWPHSAPGGWRTGQWTGTGPRTSPRPTR